MSQLSPSSIPSNHPGSMTTVMRASAPQATPKALHVALIRRGEVLDERVLASGASLTVGPSERSTFLINAPDLPTSRCVIEPAREGFCLHLSAGMTGQIALPEGLISLDALRSGDEVTTIPIDASCRGKIVIGDAIVLFHFVEARAHAPKAQLPLAVRSGLLDGLDWKTTFIAGFSFLAHFGAVGALYSDWTDPIIDDAFVIGQTLDALRDLPRPAAEQREIEAPPTSDTAVADAQTRTAAPKATGQSGGKHASTMGNSGDGRHLGDAAASRIASELDQLDGLMTLGLRSPGRGTLAVLDEGNLPVGMLDDVARSKQGSGSGNLAGLHLGEGPASIVRPGARWVRDPGGGDPIAGNPNDSGKAVAVKKPIGTANIGGPIPSGGVIPNANAVVASARAGFRACYRRAIDEDPSTHGSVRITVKVGPNGEVTSASASGASGLSATFTSCLVGRVRGLVFEPPQGGGATLLIPMGFELQPP